VLLSYHFFINLQASFYAVVLNMNYYFQQREAAQRQEEARYRALGYVKPAADGEEVNPQRMRIMHKPLDEVTCFKCGTKGHYANKCPKGHLAFLSSQANHNNQHAFKKPN
jgi:hypothetical protein